MYDYGFECEEKHIQDMELSEEFFEKMDELIAEESKKYIKDQIEYFKESSKFKDAKNEEITATTDDKGFYTLADVPQGKYMVVFEYDTSKFTLTAYEKEGTSSEKNSKVISKDFIIS